MTLPVQALTDAVVSHALALGVFERVNGHEPKVAPGNGITAAVWVQAIDPVRSSGLNSTSLRFAMTMRLYTSMLAEPRDAIDPALTGACDAVLAAVTGDYTLGGLLRSIDLLGAHGVPLSAKAGYLEQDKRLYRIIDITLPLIVNDAYEQVA